MGDALTRVPEEWRALFEGRSVVFGDLPPAPPRAVSRAAKFLVRTIVILCAFGAAAGIGYLLAVASGHWWIGLIMFGIVGWVAMLLAIGIVGAIKVENDANERRRARSLEDPIGRLLPPRHALRKAFRDPTQYAGLFALAPRPALVFDVALFDFVQREKFARSLAPRGRLPEPEMLETSSIPAGTAIFGFILIFQSLNIGSRALASIAAGAPLHWSSYPAIAMVGAGLYMIARDPWIRRKLSIPTFFGVDPVIGAGWIRDRHGEVWTVDDSMMLVTRAGGSVEILLIKPTKVWAFYLPVMFGKPGSGRMKSGVGISGLGLRKRVKAVAADAARGAAESVGIEADEDGELDMPTSREPLRLLLSSWTYPEPRTDLAMRD